MLLFKKKKNLIIYILALICTALMLCFSFIYNNEKPAQAFTGSQGGSLGTLYDYSTGKLSQTTLDNIAKAADSSYSNIGALVNDVTKNNKTIPGSTFGTNTLYFGTNGNTGAALEWMPVYVSSATINGKTHAILTLWLAYTETSGAQEVTPYTNGTYSKNQILTWTSEEGVDYRVYSNAYDASYVRNYVLNGSTNYCSWDSGSAITPPNISEMKKFTEITSGVLAKYIVTPSNVQWQMEEDVYRNDPSYVELEYYPSDWTKDNLWLPSLTEAWPNSANGIWGTSVAQCSNTTASWLRSAASSDHSYTFYYFNNAGSGIGTNQQYGILGVRPAFHLDLGILGEPQDVEVEYNGQTQNAESAGWYDSDKVTLSYLKDGAAVSPIDVGTYVLRVTLKDNTVDGFLDDEDTARGYKDVKFTITPKKLAVKFTYDSDGYPSASLEVYSRDDTDERRPTLGLTYKSSSGETYESFPTAIGTYTATAYLKDAGCGNYEIDTSKPTVSNSFTITARKITDPVLESGGTSKSVQYSGSAQSIKIQNISDDVTVKLDDGLTDGGTDENGVLTVSATEVGEYIVTVSLADGGLATVWSGGGTASKQFTLTITQATITATISGLPEEWSQGRGQTVTVTPSGVVSGDTVNFYVYYKGDGGEVRLTQAEGVYNIPTDLAVGDYVFGVRLAETDGNYKMTEKLQNFTVKTPSAEFTEEDVQWQYVLGDSSVPHYVTGGETSASAVELEYAGSAYKFTLSLDEDALAAKGVKAQYSGDTSATDYKSTAYSVTVTLTAKDSSVSFTTVSYTIYFKINKALFDLSVVKWNYDDNTPLQFTGARQTVSIIADTLPAGLSVDRYTPSSGNINVGSYKTSVSFNVESSYLANYIAPDSSDPTTYKGDFDWEISWRIVPQEINVAWVDAQHGEGEETFLVPKLVTGDNLVNYSYQVYKDGAWEDIDFPEYSNGVEVLYTVTATLQDNYSATYVLVGNATKQFSIGLVKDPVTVQLKVNNTVLTEGAQLAYTGKPIAATLTVTGFLTTDSFTISYYTAEGVALSSPPSDSGNYKVVVTLNPEYSEDFYIDGAYEFNFTILPENEDPNNPDNPDNPEEPSKPVIDPNIGEDGKFVAKDKDGNEIDLDEYLDYTYYDKDGNEVTPNDFVDGEEYTAVATVKPEKEEEFKEAFENGEEMLEYLKDKSFTFIYHKKVSGCMGCVGGIDWILVLCIGLLLFDVVMFAITMRVIVGKKRDDEDDEDEEDDDENEFIEG